MAHRRVTNPGLLAHGRVTKPEPLDHRSGTNPEPLGQRSVTNLEPLARSRRVPAELWAPLRSRPGEPSALLLRGPGEPSVRPSPGLAGQSAQLRPAPEEPPAYRAAARPEARQWASNGCARPPSFPGAAVERQARGGRRRALHPPAFRRWGEPLRGHRSHPRDERHLGVVYRASFSSAIGGPLAGRIGTLPHARTSGKTRPVRNDASRPFARW
jgi:hypothetical protein